MLFLIFSGSAIQCKSSPKWIIFECNSTHGELEQEKPAVTLTAEMLAGLPPDLKEALRESAILLDLAATNEVIARIRSDHPDIADGLGELTESFRFCQILSLLGE